MQLEHIQHRSVVSMKINKNKTVMIVVAVAAMIVLIIGASIVRAEDAPGMYFIPDGGSGTCGEVSQISLMVNTSGVETGMQAHVYFDPTCINITNVSYENCPWSPLAGQGWSNQGDHVILATMEGSGVAPGVHKFATLTIDCAGCNCTSDLELTDLDPVDIATYNTTFTCSESSVIPTTISIGDCTGSITMPIQFDDATDVGAVDLTLTYDPLIVQVDGFTAATGMDYTEVNLEDSGIARIGGCQATNPGLDGSFDLASFSFSPVATVGSSALTLTITTLKDATPTGNEVAYIVMNGVYMTLLNGDVNDDGVVNVADGVYIMKYCIGVNGYETIDEAAADVNGDTIIDMHDAVYIFKHLAGVTGFETLK